MGARFVGHVDPAEAYANLSTDVTAHLVDVRTSAEWSFVGIPDLRGIGKSPHLLSWKTFPDMAMNAAFAETLGAVIAETRPASVFFLCRSGGRSHEAALLMEQALPPDHDVALFNVAEGFEGDLDASAHRGGTNGWKARGLPWRQT